MMKFVNLVEENIEELALLDAIDAGKVLTYGKARDIPFGASVLRYVFVFLNSVLFSNTRGCFFYSFNSKESIIE